MIGDVEALVAQHLRADASVQAIVGDRVGTRTPTTTEDPWVRITQIDDQPLTTSRALHVVTVYVQLDCYGGADIATAQSEASTLVRTVRQVLHEMPGVYDEGTVTSVTFSGSRRLPDGSTAQGTGGFNPARERYILDAVVVVHP